MGLRACLFVGCRYRERETGLAEVFWPVLGSYTKKTMASPMHESRTESDIEMAPADTAAKPDAQPESGPNDAREYDWQAFFDAIFVALAIVAFACFVVCLSCPIWAIVTWSLHADEMTAKAASATLLFSISGFVSYLALCCAGAFSMLNVMASCADGDYDEDESCLLCGSGTFIGVFPTTSLALAIWGLLNLHGDEPNHVQIMFIAAICGYGFWVLSWTCFILGAVQYSANHSTD